MALLKAQIRLAFWGSKVFVVVCFGVFFFFSGSAKQHAGSSQGPTCCGARSLNFWTAREIPEVKYFLIKVSMLLFKRHCAASYLIDYSTV